MKQKIVSLILVFVVLASLLIGCSTSTPVTTTATKTTTTTTATPTTPVNTTPIKIGVFVPQTGPNAGYAQRLLNGVNLRFSEVNNTINGRPIQVIVKDEGGSDPAFFTTAMKQMVEQDKVDMIVGPFNTAMSLAGAAYLAQNTIVTIPMMPTAGDPAILNKMLGGWTIVPAGEGYQLTYPFGQYAATTLGYKKVALVGSDFVAGRRFLQGFIDGFTAGGGTITTQQWLPYSGTPDMAPTIAALGTADAVVAFLIPIDLNRFIGQYNQLGYYSKMPLLVPRAVTVAESDLPLGIGDSATKIIFESQYETRVDNAANKAFLASFKAKYGVEAGNFEEIAYVASCVAVAGLQATKGDTTPDTLRKAITGLKLQMPGGDLSFTPTGYGILDDYLAAPVNVNGVWQFKLLQTFKATRAAGQ